MGKVENQAATRFHCFPPVAESDPWIGHVLEGVGGVDEVECLVLDSHQILGVTVLNVPAKAVRRQRITTVAYVQSSSIAVILGTKGPNTC